MTKKKIVTVHFFRLNAAIPLMLAMAALSFSLDLEYVRAFGEVPLGQKRLAAPVSMALGPDSSLFVVDAGLNRVVKFSLSGSFLGETGGGPGAGRFSYPTGITRRRGFALFVCDAENSRLVQIDERMGMVSAFSLNDKDNDGVFTPDGIACDVSGLLYVFDNRNGEVLCLEQDGRRYPFFKDRSVNKNPALSPTAVAILDRNLILSDQRTGSLFCFDRFGNFLRSFGAGLQVPMSGLAVINDSLLLVADKGAKGIRVFRPEGLEAGTTVTADPDGPFEPGALLTGEGLLFAVNSGKRTIVVFTIH